MRKFFMISAALGALTLCGQTASCNVDPSVATPNQVLIASNAFNAAEATGINYLKLPICGGVAKLCRTQAASQQVYSALRAGANARNQLLADVRNGTPASVTLIQALTTAISTLQALAPANAG